MKNEIWKDIPGYEGRYQVSDYGNVRNNMTGYLLKPQKNTHGYLHVALYKEGKRATKLVAILEYEAFYGPIPPGRQVNHINEDKTDNRLENLNLMTAKENSNWGTRNKRVADKNRNGYRSKEVVQYSLDGGVIKTWPSVREIQRVEGYAATHISACCLGKKKAPYGYEWKYKE